MFQNNVWELADTCISIGEIKYFWLYFLFAYCFDTFTFLTDMFIDALAKLKEIFLACI
jgi:hypothetical protein